MAFGGSKWCSQVVVYWNLEGTLINEVVDVGQPVTAMKLLKSWFVGILIPHEITCAPDSAEGEAKVHSKAF